MTCARGLLFLGVLPGLFGCGIVVGTGAPDTDSGTGGTGGVAVTTTSASSTSSTSSTSTSSTSSTSSGAGGTGGVGCEPADDGNPCTIDVCMGGAPFHPPQPLGTPCGPSLFCDGNGACVACTSAADCPGVGDTCQMGVCTPAPACSAAPGTIAWKATLSAAGWGSYRLGPVTASPAGDVYVSDLGLFPVQKSSIHRFGPAGAYAGVAGGMGAGSGVFPPVFLGTSSLGDLLFAYYTSSTGGWVTASATKVPPSGMGGKSLSAFFNDPFGPYELSFGRAGGDDAGHWLVAAEIQPGMSCPMPCGYDFGQGPELGRRLLRYDGAGNYLGSIPSPGDWRLAPSGHLYTVQGFQGMIDVGCGPVTGGAGAATVLARLDLDGACLWSKVFPVPAPEVFTIGGDGSILFALRHTGSLDFGGGPLPDFGAQNLTIARLDLDGNVLMAHTVGGPGSSFGTMTFDSVPSGLLVLAGKFGGTVSLGAAPLPSLGDTLLAVLYPNGQARWSRVVDAGNAQYNFAGVSLQMTRQPCNMVIATDSPTVDVGEGPVVKVPDANLSPDIAVIALSL